MRMERTRRTVQETRELRSSMGRYRYFLAPLNDEFFNKVYAWPTQSAIGELTILAIAKLHYKGRMHDLMPDKFPVKVIPALNTHDGTAAQVLKGNREEARKVIIEAFYHVFEENEVKAIIPLDVGFGHNFNDIKGEEVHYYAI